MRLGTPRGRSRRSGGTVSTMSPEEDPAPPADAAAEEVRALRERLQPLLPAAIEAREDLVRIPSIAFEGYDREPVQRSAEAVAELLRGAGLTQGSR